MTNLDKTRRNLFKACLVGSAVPIPAFADALVKSSRASPNSENCNQPKLKWGRGIEGQRNADLGDGRYFNPILAGDHPDPTVLKDGEDYYMTFSSFNSWPGIVIWHSKDLVNWTPIGPALHKNIGTVWALDLCKHRDRYYIYIPAAPEGQPWATYVIWADDITGPWSDPIDLQIPHCIDPGHVMGEDGKRYLFVNGIRKIRLSDDGLSTDGELEHAYSPWRYPEDWITENFAPEGPKLLWRGDWLYLVTAVGGTAGPVTGHMVIAARSKSIHGPWEHCPHNPLVRTESDEELWWSRGHATLIEGPKGDWWMVYHGYENGFRTLGRQTLLEPIEWTDDGWFRALGGDLSQPINKPANIARVKSGFALSDDFSQNRIGIQWSFYNPGPHEMSRISYKRKALELTGNGDSPANSAPITCNVGDRGYQVDVNIELLDENSEGGLLLFYNHKAFVGLGFASEFIKTFQYAEEHPWARQQIKTQKVRARLINDNNVITWKYSYDEGKTWRLHPTRMEVSGIHHNVFGGFLSLKVGLYSVGKGKIRLSDFRYRALV